MADPATPGPRPVGLALQGGGAHGAYSWGLIEELLRSRRFAVAAVSGASAGALNGAALVEGLVRAGNSPDGADWAERVAEPIARLWNGVGAASPLRPIDFGRLDPLDSFTNAYELWFEGMRAFSGFISPSQIGGQAFAQLRSIVGRAIDIECVRRADIPMFAAATNVRTGALRLFDGCDLTEDALMASACLPDIFPAVEIDGEAYWDGGFVGNPPLMPLVECDGGFDDIVVLQVTPFIDEEVPKGAQGVLSRMTEITFNASLQGDLALIERARDMLGDGEAATPFARRIRNLRVHVVAPHAELGRLPASSKFDTRPSHLRWLRKLGRDRARAWLASPDSVLEVKDGGVRHEQRPAGDAREWLARGRSARDAGDRTKPAPADAVTGRSGALTETSEP